MLQETQLDADDPRANYMLQAGARLCKCLGSEFIPYLGVVMPSLLRSAQLKPDVNVADAGSDDEDDDDDDDEVECVAMLCTSGGIHMSIEVGQHVGHACAHLPPCHVHNKHGRIRAFTTFPGW